MLLSKSKSALTPFSHCTKTTTLLKKTKWLKNTLKRQVFPKKQEKMSYNY